MKKAISLILVLAMCLSLCACGGDDGFSSEHAAIAQRIAKLNEDTSAVVSVVYSTWDSVGVDYFSTFFGALLSMTEGTTVEDVQITSLAAAACCLYPGKHIDDSLDAAHNLKNAAYALKADSAEAEKVLSAAISFTNLFYSLDESDDTLSADVKAFKEKFAKKHAEEVDNIGEWYLESSMYVDFALEPSGSLIEYGNEMNDYQDNLSRYQKIAENS